ncbi:MAG: OPT/YSL family transporter, partial [Phycisphaerales bacterium]|nr:OPT/YSL family transporter [Phycisphaerales bacterium]
LLAGTGHVLASVLLGVALCTAITLAADMMGDLKTGYLVGSKPIKQQGIEILVVGFGPAISMLTVLLIASTNELGSVDVPAAQADALKSVIQGVQGGDLPYALYGMGGLMGVLLGIGGFAGLGVLVGLSVYLPFIYIATYGIGCVLSMFTTMAKGRRWTEEWGVPLAAGLIVGEAVPALIVNIVILGQG